MPRSLKRAMKEAKTLADKKAVAMLKEFFTFANDQPFKSRVRFCFKILFKKLQG